MAWLRTLLSALSLLAFVVSTCVPGALGSAALAAPGPDRAMATVTVAEPCPGSHAARCELKALPAREPAPAELAAHSGIPVASAATPERGVSPEVEPDPPRT